LIIRILLFIAISLTPLVINAQTSAFKRGDALVAQADRLGFHAQLKARVGPCEIGDAVEELPLRHQRNEGAEGFEMAEVGDRHPLAGDDASEAGGLVVGAGEQSVEHAELAEDAQRRGVDGVAAEIAEEIGVLFEDRHAGAGAGEEQPRHHPGGPAPGDQKVGRFASHP